MLGGSVDWCCHKVPTYVVAGKIMLSASYGLSD
jgi:hypothetical protein